MEDVDRLEKAVQRLKEIIEKILGIKCMTEEQYKDMLQKIQQAAKDLEDAAAKLEEWYRRVTSGDTNVARR